MSSESGSRRLLRPGARVRFARCASLALLVLLGSLGCGLKGDPLPPIRPPEPATEEVPAETEAADEESEGSEPAADGGEGEEDAADEDDAEGQAEEDGDRAQGSA